MKTKKRGPKAATQLEEEHENYAYDRYKLAQSEKITFECGQLIEAMEKQFPGTVIKEKGAKELLLTCEQKKQQEALG